MTEKETKRNKQPAHILALLQGIFSCNKGQLAERLGVAPQTLSRWLKEANAGEPLNREAQLKADALLRAALRGANVEWRG